MQINTFYFIYNHQVHTSDAGVKKSGSFQQSKES